MKLRYKVLSATLILLVALPMGLSWLVQREGERRVQAALDRAVALEGWRSLEEIGQIDLDEQNNAAQVWLEAFAELERVNHAEPRHLFTES
jgi:hypothetical protein